MSTRHDDRFFRVPRTTRVTSEGRVDLPILYYDTSNVVAVFEASREGAEHLLEGTGLEPALASGDRALAAMSFYEYRDTSVGTYNEVGLAIFAALRGRRWPRLGLAELYVPTRWRTSGAYVVDLPVTTRAAEAAGREIWGYPKFVTSISFRLRGRAFESTVLDPGGTAPIVTLSGQMGLGALAPAPSLITFTMFQGALLRTEVTVRGAVTVHAPGGVRLSVGGSPHRMASHLRELDLSDARPRLLLRTERFQSLLPLGRPADNSRPMADSQFPDRKSECQTSVMI